MIYKTTNTCSAEIDFEVSKDGIIEKVVFKGGCSGNLGGISKLVAGMRAEDVIKLLKGTPCGDNRTSCPDQLAKALENYLKEA